MPNWRHRMVALVAVTLTTGVTCAGLEEGSTATAEDSQSAEGAQAEGDVTPEARSTLFRAIQAREAGDAELEPFPLQSVNGGQYREALERYVLLLGGRANATGTVLGVHVSRASPVLRKHLKLPPQFGLMVEHVDPESAAADAELQRFDVLYRFDDQLLVNQEQLTALVRVREPGDRVPLTLYRDGDELQLDVVLKSGSIADESPRDFEARQVMCPVWHGEQLANPRFQNCADCHDHPFERWWKPAEGAGDE